MKRAPLLAALALLGLFTALEGKAQPATPAAPPQTSVTTVGANLNITPKRITFDRSRRSATVYIFNQGSAAATVDIALIDRAMLPDGQILALSDAQAKPETKAFADQVKTADNMLLISPRRATLAPGQGQTVRLRLTSMPEGATAGEFRSHLTITTIPPPSVGVTAEQAAQANPNELRFQITSVFGLSIPAIVRVGDTDVRAGIENAHIEYADISADGRSPPKRTPVMVLDLVRVGANSLFGNLEIRSAAKKGDPIGLARGVGVYPEIPRRNVRIPLTRAPAAGEKLEITFTDDDTSPGKLLATMVI